ncbi:unnamed protein product [Meloidogyne enterolobii]|uniref:Uncharacterized protein n=1 Tax=Meloidogyne enterolobii TaxID=390850 RepID=A0ACB0Z0I2_MELEN
MGLTQLGLDSLSLMALAQALNQKFEINGNIGITPADVFMIGRARELVELVSQKLENEEDGEEEDKEMEEEEDNEKDTKEGEENEEDDTEEEEFKEDENDEKDDNEERNDDEEKEEESDGDVDKDEEGEEDEHEEDKEYGKLEEERKSEDYDEENGDEETQNENEDKEGNFEDEDGYETEDEEEGEENEENSEKNLPVSKEDQNFKLARECIFTVGEVKRAQKTFNENPNVWIEILNKNNFEIIFEIKRKDEKEIRHSINIKNLNNQKFERNVEMLFGIIYQRDEVELEKNMTFTINLNLLFNSKNNKIFDKINLLKIHSSAILLLCRALLLIINKFKIKIIFQLITNKEDDQLPIFAYLTTFLQNFQVEMGNEFFELFTTSNISEWHFKKFLEKLDLGINDEWVPRDTWLITGGTKGIGLEVVFKYFI